MGIHWDNPYPLRNQISNLIPPLAQASAGKPEEWMLWMMERAGKKNPNNRDFQFWQQNNEPIELNTNDLLTNTLHYTHYNPVEAGFVSNPEDWIYSSARDYAGEKGPLNIILLDHYLS